MLACLQACLLKKIKRPFGIKYKGVFIDSDSVLREWLVVEQLREMQGWGSNGSSSGNEARMPVERSPWPCEGLLTASCSNLGHFPHLGVHVLLCELQGTNLLFGALIQVT